MDGGDDIRSKGEVVDFLYHRQRAAAGETVDHRRRAATFRAMLEDTADLIEIVLRPRQPLPISVSDDTEEDREALKAQGEAIRELLKEEPG